MLSKLKKTLKNMKFIQFMTDASTKIQRRLNSKKEYAVDINSINTLKDRQRAAVDCIFYAIGIYAFYGSAVFSVLAAIVICMLYKNTGYYNVDKYALYLDSFIDFLNFVNSGLSAGLTFETSINESILIMNQENTYMLTVFKKLREAVHIGIVGNELYDEIDRWYPIADCKLYTSMLKLSKTTGASMRRVTEVVLSNLYNRYKTIEEAQLIMYQKKLEQMILCIAPLFVILFVKSSSGEFIDIMYTESIGRIVMTISFGMLIAMKLMGKKIVENVR